MRVLHTSDWHIGRRFKGVDLLGYQRTALEWLIDVIEREHVDVLCVSGDVYDLSVPSAESVRLFDEMLNRLAAIDAGDGPLEIVITPGNHDSAVRLGVGAGLMRPNVHLRCGLDRLADPVVVERGGDTLVVYALPYLDPDAARPHVQGLLDSAGIGQRIPRSHEGMMRAALALITGDLAARRASDPASTAILMAHAFVSGAAPSDSERVITVGGVDSVPASLFSGSGLDYLALGHLHRPQKVTIPEPADGETAPDPERTPKARYSGSLLAYSFSEACAPPMEGNGKSVTLLDVAHGAVRDVRTLPVASGEPAFVRLEGTPDELLGPLADDHRSDWVSVTVHVDEFPRGIYQKLDDRYPHVLEKDIVYDRRPRTRERHTVDPRKAVSEMDVLEHFVRYRLGRGPNPEERRVLESVVEETRSEYDEHAGNGERTTDAVKEED